MTFYPINTKKNPNLISIFSTVHVSLKGREMTADEHIINEQAVNNEESTDNIHQENDECEKR